LDEKKNSMSMNDKTKASITPAPEETKNIKTEA